MKNFLKYISLFWLSFITIKTIAQDPNCPKPAGDQTPIPKTPTSGGKHEKIQSKDPNAIIGPDGYGTPKWISISQPMPYTILFENDKSASAPAKYVKIIYPIAAKQAANTFQLADFGFNSLTFNVPSNTASYAARLDARDTLGLFVDVVAGYDVVNQYAFWEFTSIDPITLLPINDPTKGFLLLQDSSNNTSGHGFVNFKIKPVENANTLDTISAFAKIVFDSNDTIPTNYYKNTIDAFSPTSSITTLPAITNDSIVQIHYTGNDDVNGSGIRHYNLYVSDNGGAPILLYSQLRDLDTSYQGLNTHSYCFYATAVDFAGNVEPLKLLGCTQLSYTCIEQIPVGTYTVTKSLTTNVLAEFKDETCNLLAKVLPEGSNPVTGNTTAKVWKAPVQPSYFVKRHYEITPANNAATATGKITLYFTQQEFNDYNNQLPAPAFLLPVSASDFTGIGKLRVIKYPGTSSNGTGLPTTYTGDSVIVNPSDTDIYWNSTQNRWEITFVVNGFSGFVVTASNNESLPLQLIAFTATKQNGYNALQWNTANEINTKEFIIESSNDGRTFNAVKALPAQGRGSAVYNYNHAIIWKDKIYYRLKMVDIDGKFTISQIVQLTNDSKTDLKVFPNPATQIVNIQSSKDFKYVMFINSAGKIVKQYPKQANNQYSLFGLAKGIYIVQLFGTEKTVYSKLIVD